MHSDVEIFYKVVHNDLFAVTRELGERLSVVRDRLIAQEVLEELFLLLDTRHGAPSGYKNMSLIEYIVALWEHRKSNEPSDGLSFEIKFVHTSEGVVFATAYAQYSGTEYIVELDDFASLEPFDVSPAWIDKQNPDHLKEQQYRLALRDETRNTPLESALHYVLRETDNGTRLIQDDATWFTNMLIEYQDTPENRLRKTVHQEVDGAVNEKLLEDDAVQAGAMYQYLRYIQTGTQSTKLLADPDVLLHCGRIPPQLTHAMLGTKMQHHQQHDFQLNHDYIEELADTVIARGTEEWYAKH